MEEESPPVESDERGTLHRPPAPCAVPWLVMPYAPGMKCQAFYNPADKNRTIHLKSIPELYGKRFWQKNSYQGWVVVVCHRRYDYSDKNSLPANSEFGDCFLWNPATLQVIILPSILRFISECHLIVDCALSSPPSPEENDDSTVYFLIMQRDLSDDGNRDRYILVYSGLREQQWKEMELHGDNFYDINFGFRSILVPVHQGKFYVMGTYGVQNLVIEKQQDKTLAIRPFPISNTIYSRYISTGLCFQYYVECCDEILRVDLCVSDDAVTLVKIFKLDFTLMSWVEVESLGDHVLFISPYTDWSCSAAKIGFRRGCVFYVHHEDTRLYMFDLEDNWIKAVSPYIMKYELPLYTSAWLMIPTTAITVERKTGLEDWFCKVKEESEDHKQKEQYEAVIACEETNSSIIITEIHGILDVLSNSLHPVDYIHFRATCKAIQSKFPARSWRLSSNLTKTGTYLSPWLVFSEDKATIFSFVNPMHKNENYFMHLPELLISATIRFSKDGWLLMSKGKNIVFFYNPFTRETIKLPNLPDGKLYCFGGILFTSLPTYPDCIVFAISKSAPNQITIATVKRGNNSWMFHRVPPQGNDEPGMDSFVNTPVFWDGSFHCIDYSGTLRSFNSDGSICRVIMSQPGIFNNYGNPIFLVMCDGDLILVCLRPVKGESIRICRLDLIKRECVQVTNLGKHMLFVSYTSSFSAVAPPNSHMENKIYFPRLHDKGLYFFSLDTGKFHTGGSPNTGGYFSDWHEYINCSWIEPNWSPSTVQELDWLN